MSRIAGIISILLVVLFFCGCKKESRPDGLPELYPCPVKVIQGGAPLAEANITLIPQDSALARWPIGGNTGADGIAHLQTYGFPGVPAGQFKVTIAKTDREGGVQNQEDAKRQMEGEDLGETITYTLIDEQFKDRFSSPLSLEVQAGENPITEFDVGDAIKKELPNPLK
ncbi:MAG: carboxypeptidase regulatory-like domain-containing protein [Planctomycetia bacterium]|nr:carboxypeptidase regulatory-like domain-containing protein [Planctomycetia bacterium]